MKHETPEEEASTSAAGAINRVLEAEGRARQAVQSCARDAEAILQEARETAKRIVESADRRIGLIHHRTSAALARAIGELERDQQLKASQFDSSAVDTAAVAFVVEEMATLLTTDGPKAVHSERED